MVLKHCFISSQTNENQTLESVGTPLRDVAVKILDPQENELKDNEEGGIFVKSKTLSRIHKQRKCIK